LKSNYPLVLVLIVQVIRVCPTGLQLTVGLAAVLVFIVRPAQPSAKLKLLKLKLRTKVEKKSVSRNRC